MGQLRKEPRSCRNILSLPISSIPAKSLITYITVILPKIRKIPRDRTLSSVIMEQTSVVVGSGSNNDCSVCFGGATRGDSIHEPPQCLQFGRCSCRGGCVDLDGQRSVGSGSRQGRTGPAGPEKTMPAPQAPRKGDACSAGSREGGSCSPGSGQGGSGSAGSREGDACCAGSVEGGSGSAGSRKGDARCSGSVEGGSRSAGSRKGDARCSGSLEGCAAGLACCSGSVEGGSGCCPAGSGQSRSSGLRSSLAPTQPGHQADPQGPFDDLVVFFLRDFLVFSVINFLGRRPSRA